TSEYRRKSLPEREIQTVSPISPISSISLRIVNASLLFIILIQFGCAGSSESRMLHQLKKTKKIVIDYRIDSVEKHLVVEDPKEVESIIETISIKKVDQNHILKYHAFLRVQCLGTSDDALTLGFFQPTILHRSGWGQTYLENSEFYDRISTIVSQAEGRAGNFFPLND